MSKDAQVKGKKYWKTLEQYAGTPEFQQWVDDEFPHRKSIPEVDRRSFLKIMGAGLALAGLSASGCRKLPEGRLVPFITGPADRLLGKPTYYSSISTIGGYATGVKVKTHEGRPIKLDGNPNHPASLGKLDARTQARILDMYDPDRLRMPTYLGEPGSWNRFLSDARKLLDELGANGGRGVALVTEAIGSPTYKAQIAAFKAKFPMSSVVEYEPINRQNAATGAAMAFNAVKEVQYRFDRASVIVSLDGNPMIEGPAPVRYQHDIMSRRDLTDSTGMNRIYAIESMPTTLGISADHRVPLRASQMTALAMAIAARVGVAGAASTSLPEGISETWITALVKDLAANRGASVVIAGDHLPPAAHALCHAINEALGNIGQTVVLAEPVVTPPTQTNLGTLADAMRQGLVQAVFILGGNPVYNAPADLDFAGALEGVPFRARLGHHDDETSAACDWVLPMSHFLEAWGDGVAFDGTAAIQQPTILPLYDSKSEIEFVEALSGGAREGMEIVKSYWRGKWGAAFQKTWEDSLANGVIAGTTAPEVQVPVMAGLAGAISPAEKADRLELVIQPDPTVFDGRFANNGWLQELPKPVSNLTWDNAAYMSYETARSIGIEPDKKYGFIPADRAADVVKITVDGRTIEIAAYVQHGMAEGVVLVHLGYGRTRGGKIMLPLMDSIDEFEGGGSDVYRLFRSGRNPFMVPNGVRIEMAGRTYPLANSQFHNTIDTTQIDSHREIYEEMTLSKFLAHEEEEHHENATLYDTDQVSKFIPGLDDTAVDKSGWNDPEQYQWAMTIDLSLCTGCNACVVACQNENNIPTVGKYQVQRGREMHWIRIDRYFVGDGPESEWPTADPKIRFQPVTCMHCENAPCEPVCPVAATTHSKEGLNQMIYNRCVGTRYCSNNCPYKVRRFNFLNYGNHNDVPVKTLLNNPDVTVRGRGVMEKCTYCVQRINHARIDAKKRGTPIVDGEVTTACMDACPSNAITFGSKSDPESAVTKRLEGKRGYKLLDHELNTKPRTTYLARVTNPNQEIEA